MCVLWIPYGPSLWVAKGHLFPTPSSCQPEATAWIVQSVMPVMLLSKAMWYLESICKNCRPQESQVNSRQDGDTPCLCSFGLAMCGTPPEKGAKVSDEKYLVTYNWLSSSWLSVGPGCPVSCVFRWWLMLESRWLCKEKWPKIYPTWMCAGMFGSITYQWHLQRNCRLPCPQEKADSVVSHCLQITGCLKMVKASCNFSKWDTK